MQKSSSGSALAKSTVRGAGAAQRRAIRLSRRPVLWGVALVLTAHIALTAVLSFLLPEIRDPDQIFKLRRLQECLSENDPARPLVLMMGSSRVAMGYRPELVERRDGPLYYNYGLCFSGPLLNLITLHRLLDAGIHPHTILLEVWPPHLATETASRTDTIALDVNRLSWQDLRVLAPYSALPKSLQQTWMVNRLESWWTYRFTLTRLYAPEAFRLTEDVEPRWTGMHELGWLGQSHYRAHPPPEIYQRFLVNTRYSLCTVLHNPNMAIDARSALTDFAKVCQQHGIRLGLIWLPESPEFRRSYGKEGLAQASAELQSLARQEGTPVIDTNDWIPEEGFVDGYHLTHAGAALFTRMLEREVLTPFVAHAQNGLTLDAGILSRKSAPGKRTTSERKVPTALSIR